MALIRALLGALAWLPLPLSHGIGAIAGLLLYWLPTRTRQVSARNLELCLPELSGAERTRLLRRALVETGKTFGEAGHLLYRPPASTLRLVRQVSGGELFDRAVASRQGVIVLSPHLGAWELAGLYCASRAPMTTLYRPPRIGELEGLVRASRARTGATLVPSDVTGVRALLRALAGGAATGILPDQEPPPGSGDFAPFFGIPAYTMTLVSRLARRSTAAVMLCYAERLSWGRGYRLHFFPAHERIRDPSLPVSLAALNADVERCVRALPSQYQWGYKRFRTRPAGAPRRYPKT